MTPSSPDGPETSGSLGVVGAAIASDTPASGAPPGA